ncbi:hypothetical protein [Azospirillum sp. TSO22-1]|uniref:hypothetical protein n=1 Tax=Azospirillum sp. TSO22-1 TaxID=716789 RepID=UPI000D607D48|nr:hypothetical protein [Azospirillum sp. TSO22-1]PWC42115.1 hypothetical protein TSO221_22265 [Azospirillum sp. TSO22-1]
MDVVETVEVGVTDLDGPADAEADALLDLFAVGIHAVLPDLDGGLAGFASRLARAGVVRPVSRAPGAARTSVRLDVRFTVPDLPDGGKMELKGQLCLTVGDRSIIVTPASVLRGNALRSLRERLTDVGPKGLDGNDNVVGAREGDRGRLLRLQLRDVELAFDAFLAALRSAALMPGDAPLSCELRLWSCEICRDITESDAPSLVASLRNMRPPDAAVFRSRFFVTSTAEEIVGNLPAVTWNEGHRRGKVESKIYAKRADLLRLEVKALDRAAVKRLLGRSDDAQIVTPLSGRTIAALLARVAEAAQDRLDVMWEFRQYATTVQEDRVHFLGSLAPLLRVINPPTGRGGRPISDETRTLAYRAIETLIQLGSFSAVSVRRDNPVRQALDEMADDAEGGLVTRGGRHGSIYVVRPEYAKAREAAAVMLAPSPNATGVTAPAHRDEGATSEDIEEQERGHSL